MPASPVAPTAVRSAAVVNAEIRALAGRIALSAEERAELVRLWAEWAEAARTEDDERAA